MLTNVLSYLEMSAEKYPKKTALIDENKSFSYAELLSYCKKIGTALTEYMRPCEPVGIYLEKSAEAVMSFFGTVYAGGFYSTLNNELPEQRLQQIVSVLKPAVIITDREHVDKAAEIFGGVRLVLFEELSAAEKSEEKLASIRNRMIDTDPLYINFTSGSTGVPKGIVVGHRSVIDFFECFTKLFDITEKDVVANQAPFDFDVSVKDIYSAFSTGATLVVVPRRLFSDPTGLVDFLCEHKVTTMIWAVSALCLMTTFHALEYKTPETINKILFSGEVMPLKALKNFKKHLPDAVFVNLYGPTEITCNCTYHIIDKERDYSDGIPIGEPFPNEDVFLLDENDRVVTEKGNSGEICVRGAALALGYYKNPEQNAKHFVQNPLNPFYPELIYRTGDLARFDENGDMIFSGRKDFQIKYMGHRIELEEIEREMSKVDGVERCCCIFDEKKQRLRGFYIGDIDKEKLHSAMSSNLPAFMVPGILRKVDDMPLTKNGKIDRKKLAESLERK